MANIKHLKKDIESGNLSQVISRLCSFRFSYKDLKSALRIADSSGDKDIFNVVLDATMLAKDKISDELCHAAECGNETKVDEALKKGADPNHLFGYALVHSFRCDNLSITRKLMPLVSKLTLKEFCLPRMEDIIFDMVSQGNTDYADFAFEFPYFSKGMDRAVARLSDKGNTKLIDYLIKNGVDVSKNHEALISSVASGRLTTSKFLMESGISPFDSGAATVAVVHNRSKILSYILRNYSPSDDFIKFAVNDSAKSNNIQCLRILLKQTDYLSYGELPALTNISFSQQSTSSLSCSIFLLKKISDQDCSNIDFRQACLTSLACSAKNKKDAVAALTLLLQKGLTFAELCDHAYDIPLLDDNPEILEGLINDISGGSEILPRQDLGEHNLPFLVKRHLNHIDSSPVVFLQRSPKYLHSATLSLMAE